MFTIYGVLAQHCSHEDRLTDDWLGYPSGGWMISREDTRAQNTTTAQHHSSHWVHIRSKSCTEKVHKGQRWSRSWTLGGRLRRRPRTWSSDTATSSPPPEMIKVSEGGDVVMMINSNCKSLTTAEKHCRRRAERTTYLAPCRSFNFASTTEALSLTSSSSFSSSHTWVSATFFFFSFFS